MGALANQLNKSILAIYKDPLDDLIPTAKTSGIKRKTNGHLFQAPCWAIFALSIFSGIANNAQAQVVDASQSGFTWISKEHIADTTFGAGYTGYCALKLGCIIKSPYSNSTVKNTLYQGGINVPMFISGKGVSRE